MKTHLYSFKHPNGERRERPLHEETLPSRAAARERLNGTKGKAIFDAESGRMLSATS